MTDKEFDKNIKLILLKNKDGLKCIYNEYISFIYRITYDVLQNKADAEDVTSDFFVKLWNISDKYKKGNGHKAWLARIARNMAIDYLRKNRKEVLSDVPAEVFDNSINSDNTTTGQYENKVLDSITINQMLSCLKEKERQIINMKIIGELTFKEISEILDIPMGTVTWRYQSAIKNLKKNNMVLSNTNQKERCSHE